MIRSLLHRLISDYGIFNRIRAYEELLRTAISEGYTVMRHCDFVRALDENKPLRDRVLLVRHDIDTDPNFCFQWLEVEKKLGINTSYFFRLSTAKKSVMQEVVACGGECGYHYEEAATVAKEYRVRDVDTLEQYRDIIEQQFAENVKRIESIAGTRIVSVVSHGDFVNRKLQLPNHSFVNNQLLKQCQLAYEGYDHRMVSRYSVNISDHLYPTYFRGEVSPMDAIRNHLPVVHLLVHPRHWRSSWYWNTRENVTRLIEGVAYRFLPTKPIR